MIAVAGWLAAMVALACLLRVRHRLARRMDLVARACHELRRPLTAARLGLELLAREVPERDRTLGAIDLELASAGIAVEDLSAALLGASGPTRAGMVDVGALLADALEAYRPMARMRGVELDLCWRGGPVAVAGDRLRLAQATSNLIVNAIEHGHGRVQLTGTISAERVEIAVADEGPGLPVAMAEFAPRRGRHPRRARDPRRGHGLAIAAEVAQRHGGELIASATGRSELALTLPVRQD